MGGTLPAMARFAVSDEERQPGAGSALLYGMNTLGAVASAVSRDLLSLSNVFGNSAALYIACVLMRASRGSPWFFSRGETLPGKPPGSADAMTRQRGAAAPLPLVLARFLRHRFRVSPDGIGLVPNAQAQFSAGPRSRSVSSWPWLSSAFFWWSDVPDSQGAKQRPATLNGFACTCALEALFVTIPFAPGDRLVVLAMHLQPLGELGFYGSVLGWFVLCSIMVLSPSTIIAGIQFPCLLLSSGRGRDGMERKPDPPMPGISPEQSRVRLRAVLVSFLLSLRRGHGGLWPFCSSSVLSWPRSSAHAAWATGACRSISSH